jgi:hypothetical protein
MHVITPDQLKRIIKDIVIGMGEPCMVVGASGGGKSEIAAQAIEEAGAFECDVRLAMYESVDLHGIPAKKDNHLIWFPPATLPFKGNDAFPDDRPIVLKLDEITSAKQDVFAIAYQLVNERRVGEHELKDNVSILALGNRAIDRGIVNRMPFPLCNRLTWFELGLDVEAWCDFMTANRGMPPIFNAFMRWRKNLLSTFDPAKVENIVATPRTWGKAINYWNSSLPATLKEAAMAGAVGEGPVLEFHAFNDVWSKIIPTAKILADPMKCDAPTEPSMQYAMSISISGDMTPKNVDALNKYVMHKLPPEFAVLIWQLAAKRDGRLYDSDAYLEVAKRYRSLFQ